MTISGNCSLRDHFTAWECLPSIVASRCRNSVGPLGCLDAPIASLADAIADTAILSSIPDQRSLTSTFIAITAANHSQYRFSRLVPALPSDEGDEGPSPDEWRLIASVTYLQSSLPPAITLILDKLVRTVDPTNDVVVASSVDNPLIDYGLGLLLPAILGRAEFAVVGRALGRLTRLAAEIVAIMDAHRRTPQPILLRALASKLGLASRTNYAMACAAKPLGDRLPFLALLGTGHMRDCVLDSTAEYVAIASALAEDSRTHSLRLFVESVSSNIASKLASSRIFGLMPNRFPPTSELDRAIELACSALQSDPGMFSAWEVQRWGDWNSEPRIGQFFPVGLVLLALSRAGHELDERIESMITQTRRADGWRYYGDWTDIPPDTDDLGLVLRLFAQLKQPNFEKTIFRRSFDLVRATMNRDGEFPVWLVVGLDEPISQDAPNWQGPRCVAVAAQFALGMIEAKIEEQDEVRSNVLEWILRAWEMSEEGAVFHYTWPFARLLLAKLIQALRLRKISDFAERFQNIAAKLVANLESSLQADGGWGSPLATSCHLAILALLAPSFDPWPSLTYLAARQHPDGSWPAEPLYRCPGKDGAPMAHGAAIITTGICLDALLDVRERLDREKSTAASLANDPRQRER